MIDRAIADASQQEIAILPAPQDYCCPGAMKSYQINDERVAFYAGQDALLRELLETEMGNGITDLLIVRRLREMRRQLAFTLSDLSLAWLSGQGVSLERATSAALQVNMDDAGLRIVCSIEFGADG